MTELQLLYCLDVITNPI